jgi:hypothetical protein
MMMPPNRSKARRLTLQRRVLLAIAVLASAATAVVLGFAIYLIGQAYSGPSGPQSMSGLAFVLAVYILLIFGLPAAVTCGLAWVGYAVAARRSRLLSR